MDVHHDSDQRPGLRSAPHTGGTVHWHDPVRGESGWKKLVAGPETPLPPCGSRPSTHRHRGCGVIQEATSLSVGCRATQWAQYLPDLPIVAGVSVATPWPRAPFAGAHDFAAQLTRIRARTRQAQARSMSEPRTAPPQTVDR